MKLTQTVLLVGMLGAATVWGDCSSEVQKCLLSVDTQKDFCDEYVVGLLECVKQTGQVCMLKEDNTTFKEHIDYQKRDCKNIMPVISQLSACPIMRTCINAANPPYTLNTVDQRKELLTTSYWCRLTEEYYKCGIQHADSCMLKANDTLAMESAQKRVCVKDNGASFLQADSLAAVIALMSVALLQKLISA